MNCIEIYLNLNFKEFEFHQKNKIAFHWAVIITALVNSHLPCLIFRAWLEWGQMLSDVISLPVFSAVEYCIADMSDKHFQMKSEANLSRLGSGCPFCLEGMAATTCFLNRWRLL